MSPPKICLNMIVKNESARIERCLAAALPYIDAAVLVDTGSSDKTLELAASLLAGKRFVLEERPWVDFSTNRNEALELARGAFDGIDYLLLLDADHELFVQPGALDKLSAPAYQIELRDEWLTYCHPRLIRRDAPARYVGVTHEFLDIAADPVRLAGVRIVDHTDGANRPDKFSRDIQLLQDEIGRKPDDARTWFYLAQSHRDNGQPMAAYEAYLHRARMPGWDEETWYALWQAAKMADELERDDAPGLYLRAIKLRPSRAEAYVDLATWFRKHELYDLALKYARKASLLPMPSDRLFVHDAYYSWRWMDEVVIASFYVGELTAGRAAAQHLLTIAPPGERPRIAKNLAFYR